MFNSWLLQKLCKANAIKFTWIAEPLPVLCKVVVKIKTNGKNIVLRKGSSVDDMSMDALFGGIGSRGCTYTCHCKGLGSMNFNPCPSHKETNPSVMNSQLTTLGF